MIRPQPLIQSRTTPTPIQIPSRKTPPIPRQHHPPDPLELCSNTQIQFCQALKTRRRLVHQPTSVVLDDVVLVHAVVIEVVDHLPNESGFGF